MPRARMGAQHRAGAVPHRMAQQSWEQDRMLRGARKGSLIVFGGGGEIYVVLLFFLLVAKNNLISLAFEATRGVNSDLIWMCVSA